MKHNLTASICQAFWTHKFAHRHRDFVIELVSHWQIPIKLLCSIWIFFYFPWWSIPKWLNYGCFGPTHGITNFNIVIMVIIRLEMSIDMIILISQALLGAPLLLCSSFFRLVCHFCFGISLVNWNCQIVCWSQKRETCCVCNEYQAL